MLAKLAWGRRKMEIYTFWKKAQHPTQKKSNLEFGGKQFLV